MIEYRIDTYDKFMEKYGDVQIPIELNRKLFREYGFPNEDNFWVWRETCRFVIKEYETIDSIGINLSRFEHPSEHRSGMVAYTESPEKGRCDLQLRVKPGKFFRRMYPHLSESGVRIAAEHFRLHHGDLPELKWASTEDGIEWVYDHSHGFGSCMSKDYDEFESPFHPVRMYGKCNDTVIAYLTSKNEDQVTSRTIVNTKTREYVRIFGDNSCMEEVLRGEGYSEGDLTDCEFPAVYVNCGEAVVMPYLDIESRFDISDDIIVVCSDGELSADTETGIVELEKLGFCGCCEMKYSYSRLTYSNFQDEHICEDCRDEYYTPVTRGSGDRALIQLDYDGLAINKDSGQYFLEEDAGELDIAFSDHDGEWFNFDNVVELDNGDTCHYENATEIDGRWFHSTDVVENYDGELIPVDECHMLNIYGAKNYALETEVLENIDRLWLAINSRTLYYFPESMEENLESEVADVDEDECGSLISIQELFGYWQDKAPKQSALEFIRETFKHSNSTRSLIYTTLLHLQRENYTEVAPCVNPWCSPPWYTLTNPAIKKAEAVTVTT